MTKRFVLKSQTRDKKDSNPLLLRKKGFVPAVLYGPKIKNISLKINRLKLEQAYGKSGEFALLDLEIDKDKTIKVIIKDIQKNIINGQIEHVDFYEVDMKKSIEVEIPLEFIGEAPAVKELGGTLMKNLESIEVKCLPENLIEKIDVDLSHLKTYEEDIKVKDLEIPDNFEVITQLEAQVANVLAPRKIEEEEKAEEEKAEEEKTDEEKTKKETGEPAAKGDKEKEDKK